MIEPSHVPSARNCKKRKTLVIRGDYHRFLERIKSRHQRTVERGGYRGEKRDAGELEQCESEGVWHLVLLTCVSSVAGLRDAKRAGLVSRLRSYDSRRYM